MLVFSDAITHQRGRLIELKPWTPQIVTFLIFKNTDLEETVIVHHELSAITVRFAQRVNQLHDSI
ncbi:hypothetical protein D3C78_1902080 [compost metagenome]